MRLVLAPGAVLMSLLAAGSLFAQVGRDIRFVSVELAEVRAGPSDREEFYVTNHLRRGQPVEVVAEEPGGWLAIRPPEGSFSYINTRFLRHISPDMPNHVVTLDGVEVEVFIGSEVVNKRPTIVGSRLPKGSQVVSRGRPIPDEDGTWMPIEPPERERRYIRAAHVARKMPEPGQAAVATSTAAPSSFTPAPGASVPSANRPATPGQLYRQAQQAERAGQLAEAIRLYALAGAEAAHTQPGLSALALQRAQFLQGGYQSYGAETSAPLANRAASTSVVQVSPATRHAPEPRRTAANSSAFTLQPAPPRGGTPTSWMRYRGVLRPAGRVVEGQPVYALDDPETLRPMLYATASPGLRLGEHLNQVVELHGYTVYRGDLRNNLMTVARIIPSP